MNPNLCITFESCDLTTGEVDTTRIYSKVRKPITSEMIVSIENRLTSILSNDVELAFDDVFIHIELIPFNSVFFGHNDIFCSKLGNIHSYRMILILNSLKRILL